MTTLLELPDGDILAFDEDGEGVILTRARSRKRGRTVQQVRAEWARLEKTWMRIIEDFLNEEGDIVAKRVQASSRRLAKVLKPVEERRDSLGDLMTRLFDKVSFQRRLKSRVADPYSTVVDVALEGVRVSIGASFAVKPGKKVAQLIETRANQLAGSVADTTYDLIKGALVDGIDAGDAVPDLANRIRDVFRESSPARAEMIARTEVVGAYNGATFQGGMDLPEDVVVAQQWLATNDDRTRDAHAEADGQIVDRGQPFVVDGEELDYPGDPAGSADNVINCRCTVVLLTPEDVAGRAPARVETRTVENLLSRLALERVTTEEALAELRASHIFHGNQYAPGLRRGHGDHMTIVGEDIDRVLNEVSRVSVDAEDEEEHDDTGEA